MPRRNLTIIIVAALVSLLCYHHAARSRYAAVIAEAMGYIQSEYVEEIDGRSLLNAAMDGMTGELDPYSAYIEPEAYSQLKVDMNQEFGGVGIEVTLDPDTQRLTIVTPLAGTPAYKAGARPGDTIVAIDGESTENWKLTDAVAVLRGQPGTWVTMTVVHEGETEPVDLRIRRAKIEIESVLGDTRRGDGSWNLFLEEHPHIGYVRIVNFGEQTVRELKKVLKFSDHPIDALIIDVRGNPGGLLDAAVAVCDMFVDEGEIVSIRARRPRESKSYAASRGKTIVPAGLPVAVLVDEASASASEIFAACLQDQGRAAIVGQRTWGKGTVQKIIDLEGRRSALKITTATYWRPSATNIHRLSEDRDENGEWGVRPDAGLEVKLSDEDIRNYYQWRRNRDIFAAEPSPEEPDGPRPDPTLAKAVEHLQERR